MPTFRRFSFLLGAVLLAACSAQTEEPSSSRDTVPTSLRDTNIASDFTFATTRAVTFQVKNSLSSTQTLEIRNPRKELLVRATLAAGQELRTDFPLPLGDGEVFIKLGDQEKKVTLVDNSLSTTFQ